MNGTRLGYKILGILFKDQVYHPGRLVVDLSAIVARCGVLLGLYWYVFQLRGGEVGGVSYPSIAWSIFFYFMFSLLRLREISQMIMMDVRSGNIETLLSKPVSYLSYRAWWQIGTGLYSFFAISIIGGALLFLLIGIPDAMRFPMFLPTLFFVFLGSALLSLALYFIVGLLAFWIDDIQPVFWMVDKSVMILGGSYLPVALFPPMMYQLALWSPFGASRFITHAAYDSWQSEWLGLLGIQMLWTVILSVIVSVLFSLAKRRVSINGG